MLFNKNYLSISAIVMATALLGFGQASATAPAAKAVKPMKVRWLLAHQPADAFRRAAKTFADQLSKETHGEMELVLLEPKDVGSETENMDPKRIFELLANGDVELSQTITTGIGELQPDFYALDLPFLFKDHAHASRVLDGKIGHKLLASLEKNKIHGLAFTYSGGFRVIPSTNKALNSVEDFKGLRVRTTSSPVAQATLRQLGAEPVPLAIGSSKDALNGGDVDAAETTYIRVTSVIGDKSKYLNETQHSLFLTSILASSRFMSTLSPANRAALGRAALAAARIEREDSVADGKRIKADFQKAGVQVVNMSSANEKEFRNKLQPIYEKFEPMFGKELINSIRAERNKKSL